MPDSPPPPSPDLPPRVTVAFPGGGQVVGRIHGWRQGADGKWHAEVTIQAPAVAVQQIPEEDYSGVARVPAEPAADPGPQFVVDNSLAPGKDGRRLLLHVAGCAFIGTQKYRKHPMPVTAEQARRDLGRGGITTRCDACTPDP